MGKRSDFERLDKDTYDTIDPKAAQVLAAWMDDQNDYVKWLKNERKYAEPCYGNGYLVQDLSKYGFKCGWASDINPFYRIEKDCNFQGRDALELTKYDLREANFIVTNPPWTRKILHPMIEHFMSLEMETYLLFDSDWLMTKQAVPYINKYLSDVISVGRLQWIPDTKMKGKDNCCWYRFVPLKSATQPRFWPNPLYN